ncbi:MAG: DNA replication and repair protein RecF [Coriobacteriales bacterium]|nr:DNA replication and repair protein RecF [Coriobacteriales bacterium]
MGLTFDHIELRNFRNYKDFESGQFENLNIFVGPNGVGKTNLLEALQLMTSLDSFRNPKWNELVLWGEEGASATARLVEEHRDIELRLEIANNRRRYFQNGKGKRPADLRGNVTTVLFNPDDLNLAKGPASIRRDAIDQMGAQISSTYYGLRSDYLRAIKEKAALLQADFCVIAMIEPWNESIAAYGLAFIKHRVNLFLAFRQNLLEVCLEIAPDLLIDIAYIPSWMEEAKIKEAGYDLDEFALALRGKLERLLQAEIASKRCLCGPHLDDIEVEILGHDARRFASQGQQRLILLIWKLAEMKTIAKICNNQPLLLLDDVMSELDTQRRNSLLSGIYGKTQTFITTTDLEYFSEDVLREAKIFRIG